MKKFIVITLLLTIMLGADCDSYNAIATFNSYSDKCNAQSKVDVQIKWEAEWTCDLGTNEGCKPASMRIYLQELINIYDAVDVPAANHTTTSSVVECFSTGTKFFTTHFGDLKPQTNYVMRVRLRTHHDILMSQPGQLYSYPFTTRYCYKPGFTLPFNKINKTRTMETQFTITNQTVEWSGNTVAIKAAAKINGPKNDLSWIITGHDPDGEMIFSYDQPVDDSLIFSDIISAPKGTIINVSLGNR